MKRECLWLSIAVVFLCLVPGFGLEVKPTIVLYTGADPGFAEMLASLIQRDERIASEVKVVKSPDLVALATALPATECIVVYASNVNELEGVYPALARFFEDGGAVIGLREICYEPSAGELAITVFPTHANVSSQEYLAGQKRARNYTKAQPSEISSDLPDSFELVSAGIYYCGYANRTYLKVPGEYTVVYSDAQTGAPIVLTHESPKGGRSVAFPAVWVISSSRVDVYYGRLVEDENFVRLFTNSVLWAAKGSTRFRQTSEDLDAKLELAKSKQQRLIEQAQQARMKENIRRIVFLLVVWVAGLVACAVIVKKVVLAPA